MMAPERMSRSEILAVLRIGRRTARREWRRTSLIAGLVALPVAAAIVVAGILRIQDLTPEEQLVARYGQADVEVQVELPPHGSDTEAARIATGIDAAVRRVAGTQAIPVEVLHLRRFFDLRMGNVVTFEGELAVADGNIGLLSGRLPAGPDEVAVGPVGGQRERFALGDVVDMAPDRTATVVGITRASNNYIGGVRIVTPELFDDLPRRMGELGVDRWWLRTDVPQDALLASVATEVRLVAPEPTQEEAEAAAVATGRYPPAVSMESRGQVLAGIRVDEALQNALATPSVISTLIAAVMLVEVALIAGAAYATGARRRLRELGLLGAGGATTAHLRAIVLAEAGITGLVGGLVGTLVGIAALVLGAPLLQQFLAEYANRLDLAPTDVLGPVVAATLALIVAAWLPSRTVASAPTIAALQGRMPVSTPARWVSPAGVASSVVGLLLLLVALGSTSQGTEVVVVLGTLLAVGGAALLTGPLLDLVGRIAHRLPSVARLVVRDSARQRTRASAASASALVLFLVPVMVGAGVATTARADRVHGLPEPDDQVWVSPVQIAGGPDASSLAYAVRERADGLAAVRAALPEAATAELVVLDHWVDLPPAPDYVEAADTGLSQDGNVLDRAGAEHALAVTATPEVLAALDDEDVTAAISAGQVVVLGLADRDTAVRFEGQDHDVAAREVPVAVARYGPRVLVPPERVLGLGLAPTDIVYDLFIDADVSTNAADLRFQPFVTVSHDPGPDTRRVVWLILGGVFGIAMLILGLVTALSATESDRELGVMVAVGAPPRTRRWFLGAQTGYHALAGAVISVPLGIGLFAVLARSEVGSPLGVFGQASLGAIAVDWGIVALTVVVAPLVIAGIMTVLLASAPTVPPRRTG